MINPVNRSLDEKSINTYKVEPYVLAGDIYSNKSFASRGGWTWYTGSSAWYYRVGIEEILGFKLRGNILTIEPSIPTDWKEFEIDYKYINAEYHIRVKVGKKDEITINGKKCDTIKLNKTGSYDVIVTMKRG